LNNKIKIQQFKKQKMKKMKKNYAPHQEKKQLFSHIKK